MILILLFKGIFYSALHEMFLYNFTCPDLPLFAQKEMKKREREPIQWHINKLFARPGLNIFFIDLLRF